MNLSGEGDSLSKIEDALADILARGDRITKAEANAKRLLQRELMMKRSPAYADAQRHHARVLKHDRSQRAGVPFL